MQAANHAVMPPLSGVDAGERDAADRYLEIDPETFRTHFNRKPLVESALRAWSDTPFDHRRPRVVDARA